MENLCHTSYVIIGNTSDVKILFAKLQKLSKGNLPALQRIAKAFCPQWNQNALSGDFSGLHLECERKITFTVTTIAVAEPLLWLHICKQFITVKCYYYSQMRTLGQFKTNDTTGKYFSHRYIVKDNDGQMTAVVSQKELHIEVCRITSFSQPFTGLKEFCQAISRSKLVISIFDILVVDNRGKCISSNNNLISNWL